MKVSITPCAIIRDLTQPYIAFCNISICAFLLMVSVFALVFIWRVFICICVHAYLYYTGSSHNIFQNGSLIAVLKEDGSVIVHIQHFYIDSSCAGFSVPSWAVIYKKKQNKTDDNNNQKCRRLWVLIPGLPDVCWSVGMIRTNNRLSCT